MFVFATKLLLNINELPVQLRTVKFHKLLKELEDMSDSGFTTVKGCFTQNAKQQKQWDKVHQCSVITFSNNNKLQ